MSIVEQVLLRFSQDPRGKESAGATEHYTLDNALDFPLKMIPNLFGRIRGKDVLDYGCGPGWQAVAMAQNGARSVTGIDINPKWLDQADSLAAANSCGESVRFLHADDFWSDGANLNRFDITFSCGSFEHFADPAKELNNMMAATREGGSIYITFAEPWLSPHGAHMYGICPIPYINILFSEKTVMAVRSRYRHDGAKRYEEVLGGLNKMTLAKFEKIVFNSGLEIEYLHYAPTRNLPLVNKVPLLREFLVSGVTCLLKKRAGSAAESAVNDARRVSVGVGKGGRN